jgi:hypothetical protein
MSPEDIERHINKICWSGRFAFVENQEGESITIIIKSLSLKDRNFVDFIYEQALQEARDSGVSSRLEIANDLKMKQIWTELDDKKITEAARKIEVLSVESKRLDPKSRAFRITEKLLESLNKELLELRMRKQSLFGSSIEDYADERRSSAIVFCSTYDDNENKYWKDHRAFEDSKDQILISNIVRELNKALVLKTKQIRAIARSPTWRFRWNAGKSQGGLFKDGILDLDSNQQSLIYWSQVYDSVYESYERPDDSIINDDEKLDAWFEKKEKERKTEKAIGGDEVDGIQISNRMSSHGEIFVIANPVMNPKAPEIQDIENLNSEFVKKFKQKEQEQIKKSGQINEKKLRSRKNKLARKIIGSNAAVLDKGSLSGKTRGGKRAKRIMPGEVIG